MFLQKQVVESYVWREDAGARGRVAVTGSVVLPCSTCAEALAASRSTVPSHLCAHRHTQAYLVIDSSKFCHTKMLTCTR